MINGLTHSKLYPPKPIDWNKFLRDIQLSNQGFKSESDYRNSQFDKLENLAMLINDACEGFAFAGINIEDLSRKTLNVLMKVAILKCEGKLKDLRGSRIEFCDMEINDD